MKKENNSLQNDMRKTRDIISILTKKYENVILQAININKTNEQNEEYKNFERIKYFNKIMLKLLFLMNLLTNKQNLVKN